MEYIRKYESIRLLSVNEEIELFYRMLKSEMELSAKDKTANNFDGRLQNSSWTTLSEYAEQHDISQFSQALGELMTVLEWQIEKKIPPIQDTVIYEALLRLEKVANFTSSWELCGKEFDGPLYTLSSFEENMLEQNLSMYVVDMLQGNPSQILFFPLVDVYQSDVIVKWRILEKISSLKITPQQTIYKQKLTDALTKRIEGEIQNWIRKELPKLKMTGKNTVLKDIENLTKIVKELKNQVTICVDIISAEASFFEAASCNYFDCLAKVIDEKLHPVCFQVMKSMDIYQKYHQDFHVNLRDSCALSHALYRQIKSLVYCLQIGHKKSNVLQFKDYSSLFVKCFMNLLQVMKLECHYRIKRAADAEAKDNVHTEEKILSSSVIVLNCICTVIDEWKHMEIEDEELKIAFLIKVAEIICDGAKIFAESLDRRLENVEQQLKDIEFVKKACIVANSVEHVREYLNELSSKMQWEESLANLDDSSDPEMKNQILRILNLIHQSMDLQLKHIVMKILELVASSLVTQFEKQLYSWLHTPSASQAYERVQSHVNEHLEALNEIIKESLFPEFLLLLWTSLLNYIKKEFQEGEPPEYAEILKGDIENFKEYFLFIKMKESESYKPIWQQILFLIELNSKSTVDLQLDYYSHVAESIVSPVEYLGHIAFQAGYKIGGENSIDLYIKVQKGQRLPARSFEMSELYVKVALCPSTMFANHVPLKTTTVTEDLDNPVFNQFFQFPKLPSNVLSVKGAVIQVQVVNQDSSYNAEAVLLLKQVQNMSGFASLEFLPVYLMPLKKFDMSQISFQVLENRSRWDKTAKQFINSRIKVAKSQKKLLPCIPGKNSCFF